MSDKIDKMAKDFAENSEKDQYIQAQQNTIVKLQRQLNEAKEEIEKLKELKTSNIVSINDKPIQLGIGSDQEEICKIQLRMFLDVSKNRELTLEETRKVEIFSKILFGFKNKDDKDKEDTTKKLSSDELLKLVENKLN